MASRALRLRDAALDLLREAQPGGVPADQVFADLRQALARALRPAIVVDMGDEEAPVREYHKRRRSLAITLRILADGPDPFAVIDPIRLETHAVMMTDTTLGGLCETLEEGGSSRDRVDLDVPIGSLVTVYQARYTTSGEALA
jgi:hypothetical protein